MLVLCFIGAGRYNGCGDGGALYGYGNGDGAGKGSNIPELETTPDGIGVGSADQRNGNGYSQRLPLCTEEICDRVLAAYLFK